MLDRHTHFERHPSHKNKVQGTFANVGVTLRPRFAITVRFYHRRSARCRGSGILLAGRVLNRPYINWISSVSKFCEDFFPLHTASRIQQPSLASLETKEAISSVEDGSVAGSGLKFRQDPPFIAFRDSSAFIQVCKRLRDATRPWSLTMIKKI